ncbi:eukaryotic translation initiation factor 3 subunit M [Plasmodium brasilianum]|uniref:Eukaryotic translation initiation factor 3 subunit M n=2 Tax=Plasmodium (Plasmodium) TaxID=418103 RepID=A0A1A8WI91_PLAMA|nr:eukaryotic translation initiation factor 3 subunit M, putative [Plasmodium malariae]KAI4840135.1 eukaryotic translation initiation factor 3 subunit M [Plasmodium brasilianum]SBS92659.1 golgi organization and biogenesis factor, putative [Plasmodium malariae]SBT75024.1 eukaryotic translation initiation factor 3 subunit M, putative [Plasmodium malariae]SBT87495.1 eukaryotic translation initiation factor 3 subunit M, putative [Plasmodium malariae]
MSVYIQLTHDLSGTVTAVTIGDWILGLLKQKNIQEYEVFFKKFLNIYQKQDKDSESNNRSEIFSLLLSASDFVFETLVETKKNNKIKVIIDNKESIKSFSEFYKEVEEYFVILISILQLEFKSVEDLNNATNNFIKAIKNYNVFPELRLKILQLLYNSFSVNFSFRFPTFIAILQFSSQNNIFHNILPYIKFIDQWIKEWNISSREKRQIYLIIAQELKKLKKYEDSFKHLKKHIYYFQKEGVEILNRPNTVNASVELIVDSINLNNIIYFHEILYLDAIQNLQTIHEHRPIYELLTIFYKYSIYEFLTFKNTYGVDFFTKYNIDLEACENKIYLLSIISLFKESNVQNIQYISEKLNITTLQIEQILVAAIGNGVIDAKIDQINKTVQLKTAILRHFSDAHWEQLNNQISKYINNIQKIIDLASHAKPLPGK